MSEFKSLNNQEIMDINGGGDGGWFDALKVAVSSAGVMFKTTKNPMQLQ